MSNSKNICPKCGGGVVVWADVDAEIQYNVDSKGKLRYQKIVNCYQSDGRCGVRCKNCSWELHSMDMDESDVFLELADDVLRRQENMRQFNPKQSKPKLSGKPVPPQSRFIKESEGG